MLNTNKMSERKYTFYKLRNWIEILNQNFSKIEFYTFLENPTFSTADLDLIEAELQSTISKVFDRVEIQNQLTWTKTIFTERVKKLQEELEYIDNELGETQKMADRMYNDLYDSGKYRINTLQPLDLDGETANEVSGRQWANK